MQYKNFIREQDAKMNQFVEANNQLHSELTSVRSQLEESVAQIQILQVQKFGSYHKKITIENL